ncbi:hypothetical protein B0O99DRAFT_631501 [Bisporella sp. PMI_857]|nr:hypothetical protein B0O99DRAFT_631501 [Bisporella sp. PMI_857]
MPSRRSHKKSRRGCLTCKRRKIKCDELRPECSNCLRHSTSCDFAWQIATTPSSQLARVPISRNSRQTRSISLSNEGSPESTSVSIPESPAALSICSRHPETSHLLELRLIHVFTSSVANTMTVSGSGRKDTWGAVVPSLAFNAPYLMDAIFAVSALYLRSHHPEDQTLTRASHTYMRTAIAQFKSLLNAPLNASDVEALFVTSSLIAFYATAARLFSNDVVSRFDGDQEYTPPLEWFLSYQGVKTIVLNSWQWLRDSPNVLPIINTQPALALELSPNRPQFFDPLLNGVDEQLQFMNETLATKTRTAYEHSVAFLNWAHQRPERNRLMGFAATVSTRFVDMLAEKDPRTLVIVACFFAMTRVVDNIWWLQGIAKKEVMGLFSLLPEEWWPQMVWAIKVSTADEPLNEEVWGPFTRSDCVQEENGLDGDIRSHIDYLVSIIDIP